VILPRRLGGFRSRQSASWSAGSATLPGKVRSALQRNLASGKRKPALALGGAGKSWHFSAHPKGRNERR